MVAANYLQAEDDFRAAALVGARSGGPDSESARDARRAAVAGVGALSLVALLYLEVAAYAVSLVAAGWFIARSLNSPSKIHDGGRALSPAAAATAPRGTWPRVGPTSSTRLFR